MTFTDKLQELMDKENLNQHTLSKKSGIPYMTIHNWFQRGYENMSLSTFKKLCQYFGVTFESMAMDELNEIEYTELRTMVISKEDAEILNKYHCIDDDSRDMIKASLESAYNAYLKKEKKEQEQNLA